MEEKNIEYCRFTKPLIDDPNKLYGLLANLTAKQKISLAKLARKIKPVLRCSPTTKVEEVFNYKVKEFDKASEIITSVSADGQLEVKSEPRHVYKGTAYDVVKVPKKWRILDLEEIPDETSEEYQKGFFAYAHAGYSIFDCSYFLSPSAICKAPRLVKICEIATLHFSPYVDTFMPSEAEVLIQIPPVLKNIVDAYEIYLPDTNPECMIANYYAHGEHHKAYARLFRLADGEEEPEKVKEYYNSLTDDVILG